MGILTNSLDRISNPNGTNLGHWSRSSESSDNRTYAEWKADKIAEERKRELAVAQREATKALSEASHASREEVMRDVYHAEGQMKLSFAEELARAPQMLRAFTKAGTRHGVAVTAVRAVVDRWTGGIRFEVVAVDGSARRFSAHKESYWPAPRIYVQGEDSEPMDLAEAVAKEPEVVAVLGETWEAMRCEEGRLFSWRDAIDRKISGDFREALYALTDPIEAKIKADLEAKWAEEDAKPTT
jgi:hypothetical protein